MPRASLRKIKSAPKHLLLLTAGVVVLLLCVVVLIVHDWHTVPQYQGTATLKGPKTTYSLEVASTEAAQEKGLGDRAGMADSHGMLFPYPADGERCFWMKDMHFPLDIMWVDSVKRIIHIEPHLSPDTYPRAYCFRAQYVIELNSGEAARNGWHPGTLLDF